jgi:hypothetical protein
MLLHQNVQHYPVLIDSSPEIMDLATDPDKHLVEIPFIPGFRATALKGGRVLPAKTDAPVPNAFIADGHAPGRQDQFDIPQAKAETVIQPDRMGDDLRRKTEASVGVWDRLVRRVCSRLPFPAT